MARRKSKSKTSRLPYTVRQQIEQAREWLEAGEEQWAGRLLTLLDDQYGERPEVLELWVDLYYAHQNWPAYEWNLYRLVQADPEHVVGAYALGAAHLVMERPALAVQVTQAFLERWPEHEKAAQARQVLQEAQPQVARRMQEHDLLDSSLPANSWPSSSLDLLAAWELADFLYENEEYAEAAQLTRQLLEHKEDFLPALRLQIQILEEDGALASALSSLERLLELQPDDSAALAQQVQFCLRSGDEAAARQAAEKLLAIPPHDLYTWLHQLIALIWLDDTRAALALYERSRQAGPGEVKALDENALFLHLAAYTHASQGQEKTARKLWRRALKHAPDMVQARENLDDLDEPPTRRCGPWAFGLFEWLPPTIFYQLVVEMERVTERASKSGRQAFQRYLEGQPQINAVVPYMLQRGNALMIELVLGLAALSQHPHLLEALKPFVTGQHGSDAHRLQAAYLLLDSGWLAPGEQRLWLFGDWQRIRLRRYEVLFEPMRISANPRARRLADKAVEAIIEEDYGHGQELLEQALALAPDSPELINNLAITYRELGDLDHAQALVETLRQRFPDYLLGIYAEAQMALGRGATEEAAELLEQIAARPQLHISELDALCQAQVTLHMQEKQHPEALAWLELLAFHEPGSEAVDALREEYFEPKDTSGLAEKLIRRLSGPTAPDG